MNDNYYEVQLGEMVQAGDESKRKGTTNKFQPVNQINVEFTNRNLEIRRNLHMFKTKEDQTAVKEILSLLNKTHNTSFSYATRVKISVLLSEELRTCLLKVMSKELTNRILQLFNCEANDNYEILIQCVREAEQEQEKKKAEKRIVKMLNTIREHHHQAATFIDKPGLIKVKSGMNCESDDGWEFIEATWDSIYNWLGY